MRKRRIEISKDELMRIKEKLNLQVYEGKKYLKVKVGDIEYVCRKA